MRATRTVFFLVECVLELHVCVGLSLAHFSLVLCVACYFSVHKPALAHELTASLLGVLFIFAVPPFDLAYFLSVGLFFLAGVFLHARSPGVFQNGYRKFKSLIQTYGIPKK